jgi:hypothetical protein
MVPRWHHEECLFKSEVIFSVLLVSGMKGISEGDRARITARIAKVGVWSVLPL